MGTQWRGKNHPHIADPKHPGTKTDVDAFNVKESDGDRISEILSRPENAELVKLVVILGYSTPITLLSGKMRRNNIPRLPLMSWRCEAVSINILRRQLIPKEYQS